MWMKAEGIHHIDLRVSDYQKSISFYNSILRPLGFGREYVKGEKVTCYVRGATSIGIRPVKKRPVRVVSYSYKRAGMHHLAISVPSKKDVDNFYRLLKLKNVRVLYPPKRYPQYSRGYYAVFFLDPDGMELEVLHW